MGVVCTGFGFHHGQMVRDLTGNEDWCANYQAAQTRSVVNPACNGWGEHSPDQSTCIPNDPPEKIRHPPGDWKWYHNTNKWHYEKKAGADVYRHNSNSDVVATQCSGSDFFGEFEYGELKIDYVGQQDWCVKVRREMPSSCPANHSHVKM